MDWVAIDALGKHYSGVPALEDFRLSIRKGELISLLGPSGCGKTTTLRIIAGFESASTGTIHIGGKDLLAEAPNRRGMGVVFQNYALFPHLSAADNIAFGLRIARHDGEQVRRRVEQLLDLVGLTGAGHKLPRQMSGGQQQRIAVARALAIDPRMLLLDEPLSALDAVVRVGLRDKIREIQTTLGITTLFVTHDQEEALAVSDRIVVMRGGRIEQIGTPEDIYIRPASRFVASFIGKMNLFDGLVRRDGESRIECGAFALKVAPQHLTGLTDGAPATVLVRPESVTIGDPDSPDGADNSLIARVETVIFLGGTRHLILRGDGFTAMADVPTAGGPPVARGDKVRASFPVEVCRVLANGEPSAARAPS